MKATFAKVTTILKYLCTFVLFITFFSVFAEPATNEFLREVKISVKVGKLNVIKSFFYRHKVVVKESQYYTQSITAPAILICPDFGQNQKVSFRISRKSICNFIVKPKFSIDRQKATVHYNGDWIHTVWNACNKSSEIESVMDFYSCYESLTYKKEDLVLGSYYWDYINWADPALNISWDKLSYSMLYGQCQWARNIGEIEESKFIKIKLNKSLEYKVWIHDPDFFFMSWNPKSVPKISLKLSFNNTHIIQFISKEKRSLMSGCTKYKKTTFTTCIVRHIVNEVGCKVSSNKCIHQ